MDDSLSDEDLMLRYGAGDASAFDILYGRHKGGLYRYLLRQLRDRTLAEELFQDVWLNLINARGRYTVQARFSTYLYRIAHNRLIDWLRRRNSVVTVSLDGTADGEGEPADVADERTPLPETGCWAAQQLARIVALVEALPATQREAFLLHEEGGLNVDEIAEATGVNRETAKSRLRYALRRLRAGLRDYR
ncbi:MAG: sigma-70 family RNA polymerase sigma factor [Chromatiales bacterium]